MLMAARKLQGIGLVLIVLFLAMTLYPVSLRVASKRSELAQVERDIRLTRNNIRYLETEFGARASLRQLERWNAENFAYSAPTADQYLEGERHLASLGNIDRDIQQLAVVAPVEAAAVIVSDSQMEQVASDSATPEAQVLATQIKVAPAAVAVASVDKPKTKVVVAAKPTAMDRHKERSRLVDTAMAKDSPVKKATTKKAVQTAAKKDDAKAKPAKTQLAAKSSAKGSDKKLAAAVKATSSKSDKQLAAAVNATSKKSSSKSSSNNLADAVKATPKKRIASNERSGGGTTP